MSCIQFHDGDFEGENLLLDVADRRNEDFSLFT